MTIALANHLYFLVDLTVDLAISNMLSSKAKRLLLTF